MMKSLPWTIAIFLSLIWGASAIAADGAKIYGSICSACHGQTATDTPTAPALKDNAFITKGDAAEIKKVIIEGRMGKDKKYAKFVMDMPKIPMTEAEVDALLKYIQGDLQK